LKIRRRRRPRIVVDEPGRGIVIDDYPVPGESERHAGREVDKLWPIRPEFFTYRNGAGGIMCGLCGMLGGEAHWSDLLPRGDQDEIARLRRAERSRRVQYLNRVLGAFSCSVSDWQGSKYLLSTFTGKTELVDNLAQLWSAVERLSGQVPDPLAPAVHERLAP